MGLKDVLAKMKLVELDSPPAAATAAAPPAAPPSAAARPAGAARPAPPVDLEAILGRLPPAPAVDEKTVTLRTPAGGLDIPDFAAIYRAAGVSEPDHGFTAAKVHEILSSPDFAGLDGRAKAAALAGFLKMVPGGPVPIADVIADAVRRDQALDKFEEFLRGKLRAEEEAVTRENARLQAEIDAIARRNQEAMAANRGKLDASLARFGEWQARKRLEERSLADAVAPFVESNPVSVSPGGGAPQAS